MKYIFFVCLLIAKVSYAQTISIVVPYAPGGTSDLLPRLLAPMIEHDLKVSVIVENISGANGIIGARKVASNKEPGTKLLMATSGILSINPWIYHDLPYSLSSFDAVINIASSHNVLVVNKDYPVNTFKELVETLNSSKTSTYSSAGIGSTSHLCGELIQTSLGVEITHIPYRGPAPAKQALYAGEVTMMCDNLSNVKEDIQSGRLKALAITATVRNRLIPTVPTFNELGYNNINVEIWYGLVATKGTSANTISQLNQTIATIVRQPTMQEKLENLGLNVIVASPAHFSKFLASDQRKWKKIVDSANLKKIKD
jgi:tripartite-type tricarboxylate transporter receptor subunit TctC